MSDEKQVMPRFSIEERGQRWGRVRTAMAERGVDVIVAFPHTGHNAQWEADSRYLTSVGGGGSSTGCVFPLDGEVTAITLNRPEFWAGMQDWVTDVRTSQHHTWSEPIVKRLQELGVDRHRVGISSLTGNVRAGDGTVTYKQWERLNEAFPNAAFEDVSAMMGELRAVKSSEELAVIQKATDITEAGLKSAFDAARPGITDHEVHAALMYGMLKAGSELPTMVIWGTGRPPAHDAFVPTHRVLERGDMFANEVEGKWMGYSAQRVQPAFLGEVAPGYAAAMEKQRMVFNAALGRFRPGTPFGDIASHVDEVAQDLGCRVSLTAHGRGLGEDRPMLVGGAMTPETASYMLQEGNCFILKPAVRLPDGPSINWGDTITVTSAGGRRLGKDQHEIVVIPA